MENAINLDPKYARMQELLADLDYDVTSSKGAARAAQGDTLDEARAKVIENIDANIAQLKGETPSKTPNPLVVPHGAVRKVGAKYGNYWLADWLYKGGKLEKYMTVKPQAVEDALEKLKLLVEAGYGDDEIERIRAINRVASTKRRGLSS
jgi:hypothetical protein